MINTHQYEVEVEHNNEYYLVYADLYSHGIYEDDGQWLDIIESPVFCDYEVEQDAESKLSKEELTEVLKLAGGILENVYWNQTIR